MKTNVKHRNIVIAVSITALILILLCARTHGYGQAKCPHHIKTGFAVDAYSSGNGHGTFYQPMASLKIHRNTFMAGPSFQKAGKAFKGARVWYSYSVTGVEPSCKKITYNDEPVKTELAFYVSAQYCSQSRLTSSTIAMEGELDGETYNYYCAMRLNTLGITTGMSFIFKLANKVCLRTYVGVNVYNHFKFDRKMYHEQCTAVLSTGIGLAFN